MILDVTLLLYSSFKSRYVYKYLIKNLLYFIKKLTIYLAGNIYGNNLKNTVALGMGQLLFLKRLRM